MGWWQHWQGDVVPQKGNMVWWLQSPPIPVLFLDKGCGATDKMVPLALGVEEEEELCRPKVIPQWLWQHTPSAQQSEGHGESILVGTNSTGCHAARPWNKCFKIYCTCSQWHQNWWQEKKKKDRKGRSHMGVFRARAGQRSQLRRWLAMAAVYEM